MQLKHGKRLFGNKSRYEERKRRYQYNNTRYSNMNAEHESQSSDYRNDAGKKLRKSHQQTIGELVHIRNDAAHDFAIGMTVDVFQR